MKIKHHKGFPVYLGDVGLVLGVIFIMIGINLGVEGKQKEETVVYLDKITSVPTVISQEEKKEVLGVVTTGVVKSNLINLNTASLNQLMVLPGIGPAFGQRIIDYRNEKGGFKSIEEVKLVKGIGDKTYEKIKDRITI